MGAAAAGARLSLELVTQLGTIHMGYFFIHAKHKSYGVMERWPKVP